MANNTIEMKSTIKKIKEPDFSKEIVIKELHAAKEEVDFHYDQMKKILGETGTDEEIWKRINVIVLRNNVFNEAMKILVPCYEININSDDLKRVFQFVKDKNPSFKNAPDHVVTMVAQRMIEKQLVFQAVAQEWNIKVTDDEVKKTLEAFYKATNQPVRDILSNQIALEGVRTQMLDERIKESICSKLKWKADWESIHKSAQTNNAQTLKEQEQKPNAEEKGDGTIVER